MMGKETSCTRECQFETHLNVLHVGNHHAWRVDEISERLAADLEARQIPRHSWQGTRLRKACPCACEALVLHRPQEGPWDTMHTPGLMPICFGKALQSQAVDDRGLAHIG